MIINEKYGKKLLVEGNDDQHVIWALCRKFDIHQSFDIVDCIGFNNLIEQFPVRLKQSGVESIGIIIDADIEINSRWATLRNMLTQQNFSIPKDLPSEGLVIENERGVKVGVWIMPNNNLNGMLEDFLSFLVPKDDKLLPIVNATLDDIEAKKLNKYSSIHKSKAAIHSWLAWQEDPGTPMGLGITKRYLTTDEATCKLLMNWIDRLFNNN